MKTLCTFIGFAFSLVLQANIRVSNVTLLGQDVTAGINNVANFSKVQFDLSWENSWRTFSPINNWDAAWVFIKYHVNGGGEWHHAWLNNTGHTAPLRAVLLMLACKHQALPSMPLPIPALEPWFTAAPTAAAIFL